jgi:hypothetical protein
MITSHRRAHARQNYDYFSRYRRLAPVKIVVFSVSNGVAVELIRSL